MKCVKDVISGTVYRVSECEAQRLVVVNMTHIYANKGEWKLHGRLYK